MSPDGVIWPQWVDTTTWIGILLSMFIWHYSDVMNERGGALNHRPLDSLFNRFFRSRSKKTSKLRAFGLCEWSSSMTGELPFTKSWWCGKCFHLMTSSWPVYPLYTTYVAWRMKMLLLQWLLYVIMIHCRYITNITQPHFGHIFLKLYDSGQ